jgi:hypothetical protein
MARRNLVTDLVCPFCDFDLTGRNAVAISMTAGSWVDSRSK